MKVNILSNFFCYHCLLSLSFADPQSHCCCYLQFKQLWRPSAMDRKVV